MKTLVLDQDYLEALLSLLSSAKKSIDIMSFSFAMGSMSGKHNPKSAPYLIAQKLVDIKKRKSQKIRIRFYVEGFRETVDRNRVTADFLEANGIEVKYGSTHAKGFCIDGKTLLFGSTNLSHQSITKNFEANVLISNKKICSGFQKYFDFHWEGGKHGGIILKEPWYPDGTFKDGIIDLIENSKKRIEFSIYFFNLREIEESLIEAHERGVKVRGFIHQHASFALSYIRANRATVQRMKRAGILDLHMGPLHTFSHSKYIVSDRKEVMIGTGNWLIEDVLIHPQLYLHLKDPALAKGLVKHLDHQISKTTSMYKDR